MSYLLELDYSPLWISLKTGFIATFLSFFLGIYLAKWVLFTAKKIAVFIDTLLTLPMVLPPTVAGFFLLLIFSPRRPFGEFLYNATGIKVVQTYLGCIIAAMVIAFPLMYRNAKSAFEQVDKNLIYAAQTLGMSEGAILWKILVPTALPGVGAGTVLTFARAMGEYGATSMLAGNIPRKTSTISQKIAMEVSDGNYLNAGIWTIIILVICFLLILAMNAFVEGRKHS